MKLSYRLKSLLYRLYRWLPDEIQDPQLNLNFRWVITFQYKYAPFCISAFFLWLSGKESVCQSACQSRHESLIPGSGRSPWRKARKPTPVFLPGEPYGQRSLAGYSPWGTKTQTWLSDWAHFIFGHILKIYETTIHL